VFVDLIKNPRCSKCGEMMALRIIEPGRWGFDLRTFECPKCLGVETLVVSISREMDVFICASTWQALRRLILFGLGSTATQCRNRCDGFALRTCVSGLRCRSHDQCPSSPTVNHWRQMLGMDDATMKRHLATLVANGASPSCRTHYACLPAAGGQDRSDCISGRAFRRRRRCKRACRPKAFPAGSRRPSRRPRTARISRGENLVTTWSSLHLVGRQRDALTLVFRGDRCNGCIQARFDSYPWVRGRGVSRSANSA